jgi:transcription elongation GreA/GreB family factor
MKLEDLFLSAADDNSGKYLSQLIQELSKGGDLSAPAITQHIEFLIESWGDNLAPHRAEFCLAAAELNAADTPLFRRSLVESIKTLLPPFLNKSLFFRALGARDQNTLPAEVAKRCRKLLKLKTGLIVFLDTPPRWGTLGNIDGITTSVGVSLVTGGGSLALPLEVALSNALFFEPGPDTLKLSGFDARAGFTASEYRDIAARKSVLELSAEDTRKIAQMSLVPGNFTDLTVFNAWWNSNSAPAASNRRRSCTGRSIEEVFQLLAEEATQNPLPFTREEIELFKQFFTRLKPEVALKEGSKLAEIVAMIMPRLKGSSDYLEVFNPLKGKAPFMPAEDRALEPARIAVMADIPVKKLESISTLLSKVYSEQFLAQLASALPLRCINVICDPADVEFSDAVSRLPRLSNDIIVWIFRNLKEVDRELVEAVTIDQVIRALSQESLPKAWIPAQRDLKKLLLDKPDFQKLIIGNAGGDVSRITSALHDATCLMTGEQQSLLVKLARVSDKVREHLENGAGEKLLTASSRQNEQQNQNVEQLYTSMTSHKSMRSELEDIINRQQPENREALKTARAHGDFRENSEYDAAKERRNFLSRRRGELEHDIGSIQPMDFKTVHVKDRAIIGSTVAITTAAGKDEVYYLLGARDGHPEKNWLSYKTRMGEALLGKSAGDSAVLPDGSQCKLKKISPLPMEIVKELNGDA